MLRCSILQMEHLYVLPHIRRLLEDLRHIHGEARPTSDHPSQTLYMAGTEYQKRSILQL